MTILKGPHALWVKEAHPVAVVQYVIQVGLKTRHSAQFSVDEGDAAILGAHAYPC